MTTNNFIVVEKHYIPRDIYLHLYSPNNTTNSTNHPTNFISNNRNYTDPPDIPFIIPQIFPYTPNNTSNTSNTLNNTPNNTSNTSNTPNNTSNTPNNTPNTPNTPLPETANISITPNNTSQIVISVMITRFLNRNSRDNSDSDNSDNSDNSNIGNTGNINISTNRFTTSNLTDLFPRLNLSSNLSDLFNNLGINTNETENFTITTENLNNDYEEDDDDIIISAGDLCEISCIDLWRNFEKDKLTTSVTNLTDELINNNNIENEEKNRESCPICKVEFEELDICRQITSCRHIFHCVCLDMWLQHNITCPMCRHNLHGDIVLSSRESL